MGRTLTRSFQTFCRGSAFAVSCGMKAKRTTQWRVRRYGGVSCPVGGSSVWRWKVVTVNRRRTRFAQEGLSQLPKVIIALRTSFDATTRSPRPSPLSGIVRPPDERRGEARVWHRTTRYTAARAAAAAAQHCKAKAGGTARRVVAKRGEACLNQAINSKGVARRPAPTQCVLGPASRACLRHRNRAAIVAQPLGSQERV